MSVPELGELGINQPQPEQASPTPQQEQGESPDSGEDAYLDSFLEEGGDQGQSPPGSKQETYSEDSFYDASQVPPELQGSFKEMQGAFTKKTQQLAELRKQYEGELQGLGSVRQKAQVMDQLLRDQRFVDFLNTVDQQGGDEYQGDTSEDPSVRMYLEQALTPYQRRVESLERRIAAGQELAQLAAKRPDYRRYQNEIAEALQENPNRTLEDAYNAAVIRQLDSRRESLSRKKAAQKASVEGAAPSRSTAPVTEINSISDAFKLARQMHKVSDGDIGRLSMGGK